MPRILRPTETRPPSASGTRHASPSRERIHAGRASGSVPSISISHMATSCFSTFSNRLAWLCPRRLSTLPGSASSVSSSNPWALHNLFRNESACPASYRTMDAINCARRFPCGVSPKTCIPSSICVLRRRPRAAWIREARVAKSGDVSRETCDSRLAAAMPSRIRCSSWCARLGFPARACSHSPSRRSSSSNAS